MVFRGLLEAGEIRGPARPTTRGPPDGWHLVGDRVPAVIARGRDVKATAAAILEGNRGRVVLDGISRPTTALGLFLFELLLHGLLAIDEARDAGTSEVEVVERQRPSAAVGAGFGCGGNRPVVSFRLPAARPRWRNRTLGPGGPGPCRLGAGARFRSSSCRVRSCPISWPFHASGQTSRSLAGMCVAHRQDVHGSRPVGA